MMTLPAEKHNDETLKWRCISVQSQRANIPELRVLLSVSVDNCIAHVSRITHAAGFT
jgi:hypothetical protein